MKAVLFIFLVVCQVCGQDTPVNRVPLIKEGKKIVEATGRLTRENENSPLVFEIYREGNGGPTSIIVLPNMRLAEMEGAMVKNKESQFRISGDVYAYKNLNYLLIKEALLVEEHAKRERPTTVITDPNFDDSHTGEFEGSVEDIVQQLEEATGPLMRSIRNAANNPINNSGVAKEGTRITARRCRLVRNDLGAWIAVFISDSAGLADPPCTLLPGKQFDSLTGSISRADSSTPVLLSGEIMNYNGHGFLVLREWRNVHKTDHLP